MFERVRSRSRGEPSPQQVGLRLDICAGAPSGSQVRPPGRVQCAQLQLVAALPAPVRASGNHRCKLGWERDAVESGGGVAGGLATARHAIGDAFSLGGCVECLLQAAGPSPSEAVGVSLGVGVAFDLFLVALVHVRFVSRPAIVAKNGLRRNVLRP